MRRFPAAALQVGNVIVLAVALLPAVGIAGEARVVFRDGLVTAKFEAVEAAAALEAIRKATGVEIVVPRSIQPSSITLTVDRVPFERFLQRVLDALNLGGFALVYDQDGGASRIIIADVGRTKYAPSGPTPQGPRQPDAAKHTEEGDPASVLFLLPQAEAESMRLGKSGQVIVVESAPFAMVKASECGGAGGDNPVQNVMVTDGTTAHVTSIIVCASQGLDPGKRLTPTYAQIDGDTPTRGGASYSRFRATFHRSVP